MKIRWALVAGVAVTGILLLSVRASSTVIEVHPTATPTPEPVVKKTIPRSNPVIEKLILDTATKYGIDGQQFLAVARCESSLRPDAVGDGGHSYGLFQIHLPAHPSVTASQALDPYFAVDWSAALFKVNPRAWTCYRILYEPNHPNSNVAATR